MTKSAQSTFSQTFQVFRSGLQDGIYREAIIKFDDENVELIKRYDITITQNF
jgi:hypothetical protein